MKVLRFEELNETILDNPSIGNKNIDIELIEKQLTELEKFDLYLEDKEMWEDIKEDISESPLPPTMKKTMLYSFKLMENNEFREKIKLLFRYILNKLKKGKTLMELGEDPNIKKEDDNLGKLMANILKVDKEELKILHKQFLGGVNKYKENKEKSRIVNDEDPYGEEEWTGKTEEEQLRDAFSE